MLSAWPWGFKYLQHGQIRSLSWAKRQASSLEIPHLDATSQFQFFSADWVMKACVPPAECQTPSQRSCEVHRIFTLSLNQLCWWKKTTSFLRVQALLSHSLWCFGGYCTTDLSKPSRNWLHKMTATRCHPHHNKASQHTYNTNTVADQWVPQ